MFSMICVEHDDGFSYLMKYSRLPNGKIRVTIPNYDMEDTVLRNDFKGVLVENGWSPIAIDAIDQIIFRRPWTYDLVTINADDGVVT